MSQSETFPGGEQPVTPTLGEQFKRLGLDDQHLDQVLPGLAVISSLRSIVERRTHPSPTVAELPAHPEDFPQTA